MNKFKQKIAIITGGASGIGLSLCEELALRGAVVIIADINGEPAKKAADSIIKAGGKAEAATLDVTDIEKFKRLARGTVKKYGRLDYIFNNAGIVIKGEIDEYTIKDWRKIIDVNLLGVVNGINAAYPLMKAQGFGHIVNTASMAGLIPGPNYAPYCASKHAVIGLSTTLRAEVASFGVSVSVVCPGVVDTPILYENAIDKSSKKHVLKSREDVKKLIPFKALSAKKAAHKILRSAARNKGIIIVTGHARFMWLLYRAAPSMAIWIMKTSMQNYRKKF